MHRLKRAPRLAVVVGLVLAIAAGAIAYAATEPAIQTFTPRSEKQITNIDVLRQQIRNYYGDPLGTGDVRPRQQLRQGGSSVAAKGSRFLASAGQAVAQDAAATKAIVLDVDDTTLATWNYEIFSNWAFNPATNATYVTEPALPGRARAWSTWSNDGRATRATRSST